MTRPCGRWVRNLRNPNEDQAFHLWHNEATMQGWQACITACPALDCIEDERAAFPAEVRAQ